MKIPLYGKFVVFTSIIRKRKKYTSTINGFGIICFDMGKAFVERAINKVPLLHEGPEARARGVETDVLKENEERRHINQQLAQIEKFITEAKS
jgi:hypothetical protein